MKRQMIFLAVVASLAGTTAAWGQFDDYSWAMALHQEFGFDVMAEKIFTDMTEGSGRSQTEKQQGKLGLAKLRADQGREAGTLDERLEFLDQARQLMQAVLEGWPDKSSQGYVEAVFTLVDVLEERGTMAMEAVTEGRVDPADAEKYREMANADFGRAEGLLEKIRASLGRPSPDGNRDEWRLANRAWYMLCLLKLQQARVEKKGASNQFRYLSDAEAMLEEFILENEIDDVEAFVGALYGYILLGQVKDESNEPDDAYGNYSSVIEQVKEIWDWSSPLPPVVHELVEQAYYFLITHKNRLKDHAAAAKWGKDMEGRFKKFKMSYRAYGRAARIGAAKALFRQGDTNAALAIAAEIIEGGRRDAAMVRADRLLAEIIAATADKSQFSPDIIRSAANGAWSQGEERRDEAVRYFTILLQVLDQVKDEKERSVYGAEAYWKLGLRYYLAERWLDAAVLFGEGTRRYQNVATNDLGPNLLKYWPRCLDNAYAQSNSDATKRLIDECRRWRIDNEPKQGSGKTAGELLYEQAREKESGARRLLSEKDVDGAIAAYQEAADLYERSAKEGGKTRERAMVKTAVTGFKVARILIDNGREAEALPRVTKAKKDFEGYLSFAADPGNVLTDPQIQEQRKTAQGEAKWSIAKCNQMLAEGASSEDEKRRLHQETLQLLAGYENIHADQKSLVIFALMSRQESHLAIGDYVGAEEDYRAMVKKDAKSNLTARAGLNVAKALRKPAEEAFKKIRGKVIAADEEGWARVMAQSGAKEARKKLLEAYALYREWLLTSPSGGGKFDNWVAVSYYYWLIGEWKEASDLIRRGLERFEGHSDAKPANVRKLKYRLMVADVFLAKKAEEAKEADRAGELWNEAGRMADAVFAGNSRYLRNQGACRMAAQIYGGYYTKDGLVVKWISALGQWRKATDLWKTLRTRAQDGSDAWWQATFYLYYTAIQDRKTRGQKVLDIRKAFESLKAIDPNLGGSKWKPLFEWLDRQIY